MLESRRLVEYFVWVVVAELILRVNDIFCAVLNDLLGAGECRGSFPTRKLITSSLVANESVLRYPGQ